MNDVITFAWFHKDEEWNASDCFDFDGHVCVADTHSGGLYGVTFSSQFFFIGWPK